MNRRERILSIIAISTGNLVEWFGFYIYVFCASYFAPVFFPHDNSLAQSLNTISIFAASFLMRPVGAWFFGRLADRQGRRLSIIASIALMGISSFMFTCLPTYDQIGYAAPVLLLVVRLIQSFSIGGECGVSATYLSEIAFSKHRGLFSSFLPMTLICGQLLAVFSVMLLQAYLTDAQLRAWGWRLLFLLGSACCLVVLWLRLSLQETTSEADRTHPNAGTLRGLCQNGATCWTVMGLTSCGLLTFYTFTIYMQAYLVNTAGFSPSFVNTVMITALSLCLPLYPLYGALSDKIGRKGMMIIFSALVAYGTMSLMYALRTNANPYVIFGLVFIASMILIFYTSIGGLLKAEMFPTEVRALGVSLPHALANALFGGTAEYIALWTKANGEESRFYEYVTAMALISLLIALAMPDTRQWKFLKSEQ